MRREHFFRVTLTFPLRLSHLLGLQAVRRRRLGDGRVLGKLWGVSHERGGVVPQVTCAQSRRGRSLIMLIYSWVDVLRRLRLTAVVGLCLGGLR